jgi:two-component system, chemotaxis family, protein-glutamate methylesterase/glutaminase
MTLLSTVKPKIKVLVVDDSPFTRRAIIKMLEAEDIEVLAQASDGLEALEILKSKDIDVITLDLEMPGLGGLETLQRLKSIKPTPVVVLSGAAGHGAKVTVDALNLGAFDVVPKPSGGPLALQEVSKELLLKVRGAFQTRTRTVSMSPSLLSTRAQLPQARPDFVLSGLTTTRKISKPSLVIIGISTGGPPALQQILPALDNGLSVPVVVLQHMPLGYTKALADRLSTACQYTVVEIEPEMKLLAKHVYIAPSGYQTYITKRNGDYIAKVQNEANLSSYYKPSIDFTFIETSKQLIQEPILGIILTGMGNDGTKGAPAIKKNGGHIWAQDEASSTIYGMPRAVAEAGHVDEVVTLTQVASRLKEVCR